MEQITIKDYKIVNFISEGNFGKVYKAFHKLTLTEVAIKLEKPSNFPQIENEIQVLKSLKDQKGFPQLLDYGSINETNYLIIPLLGQNLYSYIVHNEGSIKLSNILSLALQCLSRIQALHSNSFIHRDLKPQQFLLDHNLNIILIDFGLSKKYIQSNIIHIPYNENRSFVGTLGYASLNAHLGIQQSRRDDLESFCYVLSFMMHGKLPWTSSKLRKYEENEIKRMKSSVKGTDLFGYNQDLVAIFRYIKGLNFEETPNYELISNYLRESIKAEKLRFVEKVRFEEKNEIVSRKKRVNRKGKKFRRSDLCKSLNEFSLAFNNDLTEVCEKLPEFKNRKIVQKTAIAFVENKEMIEKYNCLIM